jgi:hypothetical protein
LSWATGYIERFSPFVTSMTAPVASAGGAAGWGLHLLESALSRRTRIADVELRLLEFECVRQVQGAFEF